MSKSQKYTCKPRYKWFEITTKIGCSNNCRYCPQKLLIQRYREKNPNAPLMLSPADFSKMLEHIPRSLEICFAGFSEPFENPDAITMVRLAAEAGHDVSVYTTLRGLSMTDIQNISDIPFTDFIVHLPDEDGLMSLKPDKDYLEKLDFLQTLNINRLSFMCIGKLSSVVRSHIQGEIQELVPTTRSGNVECQNCGDLDFLETPEIDYPIICNRRFLARGHKFLSPCYTEFMNALPNGDVVLCCMDYGLEQIVGNILTTPYSEIFRSDAMNHIQRVMEGKEPGKIICHRCTERINLPRWRRFFLYWTGYANNIPVLNPMKNCLKKLFGKGN